MVRGVGGTAAPTGCVPCPGPLSFRGPPPREAPALMTSPMGGTRTPVPRSRVPCSQLVSVPPDNSDDDYVEILP